MNQQNGLRQPFGEECCETETELLKESYSKFYFLQTPFNELAIDPNIYMFIGRRGSGKSSLAHYFTFQDKIKNCESIDVDEPDVYYQVLSKISEFAAQSSEIAVPRIVKIWDYVFWALIFEKYKNHNSEIAKACFATSGQQSAAQLIREIIVALIEKFLPSKNGEIAYELEKMLETPLINKAKKAVLAITKDCPIIIAVDSLEKYAVDNIPMMRATAALIECASKFNLAHASAGIHLKIFISSEVFPHLAEGEVSNTLKHIRAPVYMHWRPKDLGKLVLWRYFSYLTARKMLPEEIKIEDWTAFSEVKAKLWNLYFGKTLINRKGFVEHTFPYVLRHTQMRPRQLVVICNAISARARENGTFPNFTGEDIVKAVADKEYELATEVINSYSKAYPNVGDILTALTSLDFLIRGKDLDRVAHRTASAWPNMSYSPLKFRKLVAELGIVGRVRRKDETSKMIEADFEYAIKDRLNIADGDECVVHPMFRDKFNIQNSNGWRVFPFPDHPEYKDVYGE